MSKTIARYWNVLDSENAGRWQRLDGTDGMVEHVRLAIDEDTHNTV